MQISIQAPEIQVQKARTYIDKYGAIVPAVEYVKKQRWLKDEDKLDILQQAQLEKEFKERCIDESSQRRSHDRSLEICRGLREQREQADNEETKP